MEMRNALRKTTTTPECTALQTKTAADYDSWCYTHSHTHCRVRREEHSLIIAAVQRRSGNAPLLLWFHWLQAWNIKLLSLIVARCPTGRQITHATMPIRSWLELFLPSRRMKLLKARQWLRNGTNYVQELILIPWSKAHVHIVQE